MPKLLVFILLSSVLTSQRCASVSARNSAEVPTDVLKQWDNGFKSQRSKAVVSTSSKTLQGKVIRKHMVEFLDGENYKREIYDSLSDAKNRRNCKEVTLFNRDGLFEIAPGDDGNYYITKYVHAAEWDDQMADSYLPHNPGLTTRLPWMVFVVPIHYVASSEHLGFVSWQDEGTGKSPERRIVIEDLKGGNQFFTKIVAFVDPQNEYRVTRWEADWPGDFGEGKRVGQYAYDESGRLASTSIEYIEIYPEGDQVVLSGKSEIQSFSTDVDNKEFTPEFYGLTTPPPPLKQGWDTWTYVFAGFLGVVALVVTGRVVQRFRAVKCRTVVTSSG